MLIHPSIQRSRRRPIGVGFSRKRRGYVLVMCLLVIAVSSSIVVSIFQVLKLHTAEATARRSLVSTSSLQTAGTEHAIAYLLDHPTFRGALGPFNVPNHSDQRSQIQIDDAGAEIQVNVLTTTGAVQQVVTTNLKTNDINKRRADLGLGK